MDKIALLLSALQSIESSNGKDINHKIIQHGIHAGDSAIGNYGLMPNTINEIIKREKRKGVLEEPFAITDQIPQDERKVFLENNPEYQDAIAKSLLKKIGIENPEKAIYKWQMGHNIPNENITQEDLDKSDRVQKFRQIREQLSKK